MKIRFLQRKKKLVNLKETKVWSLVSRPNDHPVIKIKLVYRNKLEDSGVIGRKKKLDL